MGAQKAVYLSCPFAGQERADGINEAAAGLYEPGRHHKQPLLNRDEVIELNGVLTANLTWDQMGDVLDRPNRSVTVRDRSGETRTIRLAGKKG